MLGSEGHDYSEAAEHLRRRTTGSEGSKCRSLEFGLRP